MKYRRVVTGHSSDRRGFVASDGQVEAITSDLFPGVELLCLWGADKAPTYPDDGSPLESQNWFPPVGGFRIAMVTIPPDDTPAVEPIDSDALAGALEQAAPGLLATMEPESPGFHTSDTLDVVHVIAGSMTCELDDGEGVMLNPGDTLVQSGTRHAWRNPGPEPCRIISASIGAHRRAT